MGVAYYAVARAVERNMDDLCEAAWEEIEPLRFESFAVRAKRSDKRFRTTSWRSEVIIGRYLLEKLRAARSRRARAIERARADVPHGNHAGAGAGLRAENSGCGGFAGRTPRGG